MTRTKRLGDLGERWTEELLRKAGFLSIRDLRHNHAGGDFLAERQAARYFITVKARNKCQRNRSLNGGYNIYAEKVRKAAREYGAVPAWLTIQIDTDSQCFSAYFGTVESLCNPDAIAVPMATSAVLDYECLAKDTFDERITPELSNQLSEGTAEPPETLESIARHSGIAAEEVGRAKAVTEVAVSQAGDLTDYDRIAVKLLGFSPGTKTQRAVALYLRPEGATTAEVTAINGGPYLNCLKEVEPKGHAVRKWKATGSNGRPVTAYRIELKGTKSSASVSSPSHLDQRPTVPSERALTAREKCAPSRSGILSKAELLAVEGFIERTVAERRAPSWLSDYEGVASGSVFNLLRLHDTALARKIGTRSELVRIAGEMGYTIHAYPSGIGRRGSGVRETIDLKDVKARGSGASHL
ncbi:hypothetical protein [Mesorhizobium abyssinicae]|uniref:hypothetical protein n=1 Tax=Mesorhizobium abyssinicae TaxID=1209958 RepID=UPI0033916D6C